MTLRMRFERFARAVRPHWTMRDWVRTCLMQSTDASRSLDTNGFAQTQLELNSDLTSRIEDEVARFESVLRGDEHLSAMPQQWQREFKKTVNQPLRHVPIEYRPELVHDIRRFLNNNWIRRSSYKYFRARPILKNIRILYSQNQLMENVESQQFHCDPEGSRQLKVFVAVRLVDPESGPLTVLTRQDSGAVISSEGEYIRYTDEVVGRSVPTTRWTFCVGRAGTTWMIDTSNCLHFGSRRGTTPRILIYAQLLPWYSAFLSGRNPLGPSNWLDSC